MVSYLLYIFILQLDVSDTVVDEVIKKLDNMYNQFKEKYKKPNDTVQQNGFHVSAARDTPAAL